MNLRPPASHAAARIRRVIAISALIAWPLLMPTAQACETASGTDKANAWTIRLTDEYWRLPDACTEALADIAARLREKRNLRVSIETFVGGSPASSLSIARLAGIVSRIESTLLELGVRKARIRVRDYRIPPAEPGTAVDAGRVIIRIDDE